MKDLKSLLPKDKSDTKNLEKIFFLKENDLLKIAPELSLWLADANWPVFEKVLDIFVKRQDVLISQISKIFYSYDWWHIYFVLLYLYEKLTTKNKNILKKDLKFLFFEIEKKSEKFSYTTSEELEEIKQMIEEFLKN